MRAQNIGDEREVNTKRKREKIEAQRWVEDLRSTMQTRAGRRVLGAILAATKIGQKDQFSPDVRWDAYVQGEQNIGKWILTELRAHCLKEMRLMEDEERAELKVAAIEPPQENEDE